MSDAPAVDKAGLLRCSWLSGMPEDVVRDAASCGAMRSFDDGELIHARGAQADGFYTIARGAVRFSRTTADGRATTISILAAPHGFGEISVFDGLPRTHDAHAAGSTVLLFHAKTEFKRLLLRHPAIYERFARMLSLRIRTAFDMVEEAAIAPLSQRLARRLLELAHAGQPAITPAPADPLQVVLTQEELGDLLGKSRQSIAKLLRKWEASGLVRTDYGRVSLSQPERLMHIAYPERGQNGRSAKRGKAALRINKEST